MAFEQFGSNAHAQVRDCGQRTGGSGADTHDNRWTRYDTLNTWLDRSINARPSSRPVMAHINHWFLRLFGSTETDRSHAYEVVGYTPNANDLTQAVITLRNPLGHNSWTDGVVPQGITAEANGNFSMNLVTFNRLFSVAPHVSANCCVGQLNAYPLVSQFNY